MSTLVGKKLSEVFQQLILKDPSDQFMYDGAGAKLPFAPKYTLSPAPAAGPSVWADSTPPVHNDSGGTGSFAFGNGFTAYSLNYPVLGAASSGTSLGSVPQARVVLGTLGAATLKAGDPAAYANVRSYLMLQKALYTGSSEAKLVSQDNSAALNEQVHLKVVTPHTNAGTHYTELSCTGGAKIRIEGDTSVVPINSAGSGTVALGTVAAKWKEVNAANGTIITSDGRQKTAPLPIDDVFLDAWGDVRIITFQFLASIQEKGKETARWHFGVIAQQVRDAFIAHGLDGTKYGLLCYDKWEEVTEPVYKIVPRIEKQENENGELVDVEVFDRVETGETKVVMEKGDAWGIRADQCLWLEAAYQRRRCDRIEARLAALEP